MSIRSKLQLIRSNMHKIQEAGSKTAKDWESMKNAVGTNFANAFSGAWWTDSTFTPTFDIVPTNANAMFSMSRITNLKSAIENCGISLDLSNATNVDVMFNSCSELTELPVIDVSGATASSYRLNSVFNACKKLKSIEMLVIRDDGLNTFGSTFNNCTALEEIDITGTIGNDISFAQSTKLNATSFENIILALSFDTTGKTVTFSKTAKEAAFTDTQWEERIETKPNWTFNLYPAV